MVKIRLLAVFIAGLSALHTTPSEAQTRQLARVAVSTATPHNTPLWVAKDKKIFDKYGFDVQLIFVSGGALVAQMLAAGEIQVAAGAPAALINLVAGGERVALFLGLSNTSPFTLVTQPSIKSAAGLKGKRLGTARFGGSSHISALIALEHLGLNAKRDNIIILQTGLDPERMAALEAKALDAAMLQTLATKAMLAKGYTSLLNLNQAKIPYQNTVLAAKLDWAHSKAGENFTRAVIEGYGYVFNKENKQAVKEVIARNLRLRNTEEAETFYLEALEELDRKPYPTLEGMRTVLKYVAEQNPKAASVKAEEIVDTAVLKNLENEGFFDKVYGGKK
ncbi:MAG TPA: ABC transporter substrate-binding protein [Verrucomicrobiae bacterium]|nr:ABC transporter substrate-binding protein [Verrucomicrobiae bacterium]